MKHSPERKRTCEYNHDDSKEKIDILSNEIVIGYIERLPEISKEMMISRAKDDFLLLQDSEVSDFYNKIKSCNAKPRGAARIFIRYYEALYR